MSGSLLSQLATTGSDVRLWYRGAASAGQGQPAPVLSAPYKLFFKTGNAKLYGQSGTLFWVPTSNVPTGTPVVLDESNTTRRFSLSSVTDLRLFRQSSVFKSPACEAVQSDCCFSLASQQYELNIQFASSQEREVWWNVILTQMESAGRQVLSDANNVAPPASSPSPSPSPSSALSSPAPSSTPPPAAAGAGAASNAAGKKLSLQQSPEELARILAAGSPFRKFDLAPNGQVQVADVIVFTSGVGRAGLLHWVPAATVTPGAALVPVPGAHIPLARITDILMKRKSPALRAVDATQVREEACFALVTDAYTLSLEARSKEQRTQWQEGLISILTNAGKQLARKPSVHMTPAAAAAITASTGQEQPSASVSSSSGTPQSSPQQARRSSSVVGADSRTSLAEESAAVALREGQNVYMYFPHPQNRGEIVKQWAHVWLVDLPLGHPDAPGFLYFSTQPNSRTQHAAQRFALGSINEMAGNNRNSAVWKQGLAAQAAPDLCATISSSSMAWNVELIPMTGAATTTPSSSSSSGKEQRDSFLKNIHAVISRYRRMEAEAKAAAAAAANASLPVPSSPSPAHSAAAASQIADELRLLREGQGFVMHSLKPDQTLDSRPITLWLVDDPSPSTSNNPGTLYIVWQGAARSVADAKFKLPLNTISTMAAGKESALFKSSTGAAAAALKAIPESRCLSVVSPALALDLEAPSFDVRERWIRALHGVMVRHGRRAVEQRAAAAAASGGLPPNSPMHAHRGSVSSAQPMGSPTSTASSSAASTAAAMPPPAAPQAIVVAPTPTSDLQIAALQEGAPVTVLYATRTGETQVADINLFLLIPALQPPSGPPDNPDLDFARASLQWCASATKKVVEGQRLLISSIKDVVSGRDPATSALWKAPQASPDRFPASRCFAVVAQGLTLALVAATPEAREGLVDDLAYIVKKVRINVVVNRPRAPSEVAPAAAAAAAAAGAPNLRRSVSSSPSVSLATPAEQWAYLSAPHRFNHFFYRAGGSGVEERADIVLWLSGGEGAEAGAEGGQEPKLQWVNYGARLDAPPSQTIPLSSLTLLQSAGDSVATGAIFRSAFCTTGPAKVELDACFMLHHAARGVAHPVLYLEALSAEEKNKFLSALRAVVERFEQQRHAAQATKKPAQQQQHFGTMVETGSNHQQVEGRPSSSSVAVPSSSAASASTNSAAASAAAAGAVLSPHPNPLSPNSPASPAPAAVRPSLAAVDHKAAVALLSAGQSFVFYYYHSDAAKGVLNEERKENVTVWFVPSNGVDSPGTLHWCRAGETRPASGAAGTDKSRIFYLNQIKQMRAGKETPIFKSSLAGSAAASCCFSLFSLNALWNLEAPSPELREAWMKSLHQVLLRHGMKAVDEDKKKAILAAQQQTQAQAQQQQQPSSAAASASAASTANAAARSVPNASAPSSSTSAATADAKAAASASSASASAAAAGGATVNGLAISTRALPARDQAALNNNRTISFTDPTDFFVLQAKIGEGSYGAVYRGLDYRDGKSVAIKVLQFQGRDTLKLRKEIHILKQCDSPYIVGYKGAFQKAGNLWIILEYCSGGSLSDIMQICQRTFSEAQVACIMKHALAGLAYLHNHNGKTVIHRDIKGANILVDSRAICKLADFGVSSSLDKSLGKNRTVIGTPHWMAPEVLTNDDYNEKADVWSLGITAYELAIGEPPHSKLHSMRAAIKIPTSPPPTLPDPHRFSADFHSFLAACLVKDFTQRPSAASLLSHPFILKAPPESILMDNVRAAMAELESKHQSLDEMQGLLHTMKPAGGGGAGAADKKSMRGVSSTRDSQDISSDGSNHATMLGPDIDDFDAEVAEAGGDFAETGTMRAISDTMLPVGGGNSTQGTMILNSSVRPAPVQAAAGLGAGLAAADRTMELDQTMIMNSTVPAGAAAAAAVVADPKPASSPLSNAAHLLEDASEGLEQFDDDDDDEDEGEGEVTAAGSVPIQE